jgi:hypothetical protein
MGRSDGELFDNDKVVELVGGPYDGSLIPISLFSRAMGRPDLVRGKVALGLPGGAAYAAFGQEIKEVIVCPTHWVAEHGEDEEKLIAETRESGEELREFYGPKFEKWYCLGAIHDGELIRSYYGVAR